MAEVSIGGDLRKGILRSRSGMVLSLLLVGVLIAAFGFQRRVETLDADEILVLAASQSLAFDFDLDFTAGDRQRLDAMSISHDDLTLRHAGTGTERFDLPVVYPLLVAPLARWAPLRGPVVINAVLLILAAIVVSNRLEKRLGSVAAGVVALMLFASVLYRNVFLLQPTLLLAALVAIAFGLVFSHEEPAAHGLTEVYRPPETTPSMAARGFLVGILIGVVALHHPVYLLLILPAGVVWPAQRRAMGLTGLSIGLLLALALFGLPGGFWGGTPQAWLAAVKVVASELNVGVASWNLLYLAVGRNTGVVPYFLPFVALLGLWRGGSRRSVLVSTALAGVLLVVLTSPFNYFGGPAAVGNRWLIPWFALLWFVPTQPLPRGWLSTAALLAIPAMYPTWLAPSIEPLTSEGTYRHASGDLHRWLPLETTQRDLPPPDESTGQRFWVRSTSYQATVSGANRWRLAGDGWFELQMATPTPLESVYLQFGRQAEPELQVRGAELGDMVLLSDGGVGFRLEDLKRRALHSMWWSSERHYNYVLQLRMPMPEARPQSLVLTAIAKDLTRQRP